MAEDSSVDTDSSSDESSIRRQILAVVDQGNFDLLKKLFNKSKRSELANMVDQGDYNNSLLHIAVKKRKRNILHEQNTKIIQFLVEKGADIHTKNIKGETAFDFYKHRFGDANGDNEWYIISRLLCPIPSSEMISTITESDSSSLLNLDRDTEIYERNQTYEASGALKFSTHGIVFQLQLLTLFLLKAMENYKDVSLGTEIESAGKFDDVTLRYRKNSSKNIYWRFLQAKHLRNAKIGVDDLFTTVNANNSNARHNDNSYNNKTTQENKNINMTHNNSGDKSVKKNINSDNDANKNDNKNKKKKRENFALLKYFDSFCMTLQKSCYKDVELEEFTICTNADFSDKSVSETYFEEDEAFKNDVILYLGKEESQKFKLNDNSKERIQKEVDIVKSKYSHYLPAFIKKFRLVVKYPDQRNMNRVNIDELRKYFSLLDSELAFYSLKNYMLNWFMDINANKSKFLRGEDGAAFLKIIKTNIRNFTTGWESKKYIDELREFDIQFTDMSLSKFLTENIQQEETSQLICVFTKSPLLTSIHVNQYIQSNKNYKTQDSTIFLPFSKVLQSEELCDVVLNSFDTEGIFNLIILNCELPNEFDTDAIIKICKKLSRNLKHSKDLKLEVSKKIVLIGVNENQIINEFRKQLKNSEIKIEEIDDKTSFAHLSKESKDRLLQKNVYFNGGRISFCKLVSIECANSVIDHNTLVKLLMNTEIKLDDFSPVKEGEIYINRTLRPQIVNKAILSDNIFLSSNCVVISNASTDDLQKLCANFENKSLFDYEQLGSGIKLIDQTISFSDLLRRYSEQNMSKFHNMFWLENTAGHLVLKQFTTIGPIKGFICNINSETNSIKIKEKDIIEWPRSMENKMNLIAAEPGMGKSSIMSNIGRNLKSAYPEIWVKRVNLNDYAASFKQLPGAAKFTLGDINFTEEDTDQAIEFVTKMLLSSGTDDELLQKRLFEYVLKGGKDAHGSLNLKVVFLFDGFDEISPTHKDKTLILLKALKESNVTQMWVSTRIHEVRSLEDNLRVAAFYLNAFSNEEKEQYFEKFRQFKPHEYNIDFYYGTISYWDSLPDTHTLFGKDPLQDLDIGLNLNSKFIDNPLNLNMVLNVIFNHKVDNSLMINMSSLYDIFASIKFNTFYNEKASSAPGVPASDDVRRRDVAYLNSVHAHLAFETLFPDAVMEPLGLDERQIAEIARIGFVSVSVDGRIQFVHLSFAEYFVVEYLMKNSFHEKIQSLFYDMLMKDEHETILTFINAKDKKGVLVNNCRSLNLEFEIKPFEILEDIMQRRHDNIFKHVSLVLLESNALKKRLNKIKRQSLSYVNYSYKHVVLYIIQLAYSDLELFKTNFDVLAQIVTSNEINFKEVQETINHNRTIIFNVNVDNLCILLNICFICYEGQNISNCLDYIYSIYTQNTNIESFLESLMHICVHYNFRPLHIVVSRRRFQFIEQFFNWVRFKIQEADISYDLTPFLHLVGANNQSFLYTAICEIRYTSFNISSLSYTHYFDQPSTALKSLSKYLIKNFSISALQELLRICTTDGKSVFHSQFLNGKDTESLLLIFTECFAVNTGMEAICKGDTNGDTPFHQNFYESSHILLETLLNHFEPTTMFHIFSLSNSEGHTVFNELMLYDDIVDILLQYITENRDFFLLNMKSLVSQFDVNYLFEDDDAYHNGETKFLIKVKKLYGTDLVKELLSMININGDPVLYTRCRFGDAEKILNLAVEIMTMEELKFILSRGDHQGNNILIYIIPWIRRNKNMSLLEKYVENNFIEELFGNKKLWSQTILH